MEEKTNETNDLNEIKKVEDLNKKKEESKNASEKSIFESLETMIAIILIMVGVSLLTKMLVITLLWQILVIIWGVALLRKDHFIQGALVIGFGGLFILDTIFTNGRFFSALLGIGIILFGLETLIKSLRK